MEELDVGEFLQLYCDSINTKFDSKVLPLSGFYRQIGKRPYNGYFYDALVSKNNSLKISVLVNEEQREQLADGKNYTFRGYVNRAKKLDQGGGVSLSFKLLEVKGENKELQLVKEEEYDLLKTRFERGFTDIRQLLFDKMGSTYPGIAIITGNQSIVDQDFDTQLRHYGKYHLEIFRTSFGDPNGITEYIRKTSFRDYDVVAFMRGGGTGLEVFNDEELCQTVLNLRKPFITALGHQDDLVMLSKLADKNLATPTALGSFLEDIARTHNDRETQITELKEQITKKEEEIENLNLDRAQQFRDQNRRIGRLTTWAIISVIIIFILLSILFRI